MTDHINLIDLFAGAGGLSEGFFRNGFDFAAHVEMNHHASETLKTRSLYYYLKEQGNEKEYYEYLRGNIDITRILEDNNEFDSKVICNELTDNSISPIIDLIKESMDKQDIERIDGIIGGPPCQAYSMVGRGRSPDCMENDPRNYLYKHYLTILDEFKPDFFVFENVPGMLSAKKGSIYRDFLDAIQKSGYGISAELLNARDFFVLQSRKRLIVIGYKKDSNFIDFSFDPSKNDFKVWDLLSDLPELNPGEGMDSVQEYKTKPTEYLKKSGIRSKKDVLIQHKARSHIERDREIYRIAIRIWEKEQRRIKYTEIPKKLRTHKNTKSFIDRYKVIAGNLGYSHTIVAHISKDGHYNIHPDINQARSLTVREAARIQSFPDNYKFEGPRTAQFWQVGNAVPPLMAEGIAKKILTLMG